MVVKNSHSTSFFANIFWITSGFIISFALHLLTWVGIRESYYTLIIFTLAIILFHYSITKEKYRIPLNKMILGISLFLIILFLRNLAITYETIPEWDFLCFYLFGKVGISSSDFYNPHVFLQFFNDLNLHSRVGDSFTKEIVDVGFWYPPPSMLLFLPLGLFDLETSHIIWQTMIIIFLVLDVYLLLKFYSFLSNANYKDGKIVFPLLILILLYPNITVFISLGQTISLFLFLLILLIHYINSWKSGVFLASLVIIKPLAAIFILYFLFFRKWKVVAASAVMGIIILMITVLFFGFEPLLNYFISAPTNRIPDFVYFEYQSLFGVLKRLQRNIPDYMSINSAKILYYLLSLFLVILTFYALRKLSRISKTMSFLVFIPLALLIYPATLVHYIILLLPVVLFIYNQKLFSNNILNLALVFFLYILGHYSFFFFNLLLWFILITWPLLLKYINNNNFCRLLFSKLKGNS